MGSSATTPLPKIKTFQFPRGVSTQTWRFDMPNITQSAILRQETDQSYFPSHNETNLKRPVADSISVVPDPDKLDVELPAAGCRLPATDIHPPEYNVPIYIDSTTEQAPYLEPQHYLERYIGGTVSRLIQRKVINEKSAMAHHSVSNNHIRGDRKPSIGFSRKSQDNLRTKLGMLNQDRLSKVKCLFVTTTLDGDDHIGQLTTPRQFAKYRNNFLTQLRKRLKGLKWFYVTRTERQGRGSLHMHISIHGIAFLNKEWLQHTWSRIVLGKAEYEARCIRAELPKENPDYYPLIRTQVEPAKNWKQVQKYFNEQLAYMSQADEQEQLDREYVVDSMKGEVWKGLTNEEKKEVLEIKEYLSIGRVWSIGRYEVYDQFVDGILEKIDASVYYQMRRMYLKKRKSLWKKKGKCMNKWKEIERYLLSGKTRKVYETVCVIVEPLEYDIKMYMAEKEIARMLDLVRKKVA